MSNEASKAMQRRGIEYSTYFSGYGIDVGCGNDPVDKWREKFPRMGQVRHWDKHDGDAQELPGLTKNTFDWLHSSHSLEHMQNWYSALKRWMEVIYPLGFAIITVPSWEMYEHRKWPSKYNGDHKWAFSLVEKTGAQIVNLNVEDLSEFGEVVSLKEITDLYDPTNDRDQTQGPAECAIEFIIQKRL